LLTYRFVEGVCGGAHPGTAYGGDAAASSDRREASYRSAESTADFSMTGRSEQRALVTKEPLLARKPAAIARERGIAADHAVTRDDDGHGVAPIGEPHRARSGRPADRSGELAVGARRAHRYRAEGRPDRPLELRASRVHRDTVERPKIAGEVGTNLLTHAEWIGLVAQRKILEAAREEVLHPLLAVTEIECAERPGVRDDDDGAKLGVDRVGSELHRAHLHV